MIIGIPTEIKANEGRVAATPAGIDAFVRAGHKVIVQAGAGAASGFTDDEYQAAGAEITDNPEEIFKAAELIIKVKEPLGKELEMLHEGQTLFTYLHLAPDRPQTDALLKSGIAAIAYETVQTDAGALPLLSPMSEVAGRMAVQVGAFLLEKVNGGRGMLLGGVPGVEKANVVILGGGNVGTNAAKVAMGMGAQVTVLDVSSSRLSYLDDLFDSRVNTLMSNSYNISMAVKQADLVIGAVLIPGGRTPTLITEAMVQTMQPGAVLVDVAIDQGGTIETIDRITTHEQPYFIKHGVVHYSVANMPGAVPRTSTFALTNATLPYALEIANKGPEKAMKENSALMRGLNIYKGSLTNAAVAKAQSREYVLPEEAIK